MDAMHATATVGITELRESITRILKQAEEQDEAVAILNHNKPAGYIVSPRMMESMLDAIADRIADDRARSRIGTLKLAKKITVNDL